MTDITNLERLKGRPVRPLSDRPSSHRRNSPASDHVQQGSEKTGSAGFFAVDHRAWRAVCRMGLNEAICYLALARGTQRDQRTTSWSINSIEHRTGISRKRLKAPMIALEGAGIVRRLNTSEKKPRRYLVPAHEIGLGLSALPELTSEERQLWEDLPINTKPKLSAAVLTLARALKEKGYARQRGSLIEARPELLQLESERPDWVWLPNRLIDPFDGQESPVERIRKSQDVTLLRLFVDLYQAHSLSFDGGVSTNLLQKRYGRVALAEDGPTTAWRFEYVTYHASEEAPFYAAFTADSPAQGNERFFATLEELVKLGLVTFVEHLFESDDEHAEIIHPFAKPLPGRDITEAEAQLYAAASRAGAYMCRDVSLESSHAAVPVPSYIKRVQMRGICRLRHRPHTAVTSEWMAQSDHWRELATYFDTLTTSMMARA